MSARTTVLPDGQRSFALGARFYPYRGGPLFWADADRAPTRRALADAASCGFGALRLALPVAQFMPGPHRIEKDAVERFAEVLKLAGKADLRVIATVLAGPTTLPGLENGWGRRPTSALVADPAFVHTAGDLARALAGAAKAEPALAAWEVARGLPRWEGGAAPSALRTLWNVVREAIAEVEGEARRPISPGDGLLAGDVEQPGLPPESVAAEAGLLSGTVEPIERDALRHAYQTAWTCARLRRLGRPFVLSEVGSPTTMCADDAAAAELREVVLAALLEGASGVFYRGVSDMAPDGPTATVLDRAGHDLHTGAFTADGTGRGVALEIRALADGLAAHGIEPARLRLSPASAALLVPDDLAGLPAPGDEHPGLAAARPEPGPVERAESGKVLREAFVLLRTTGVTVDVITESTLLADDALPHRLIVAPLGHRHRTATWRRLLALARAGAYVYLPWSAGYDWRASGFAGIDFRDLTGCRHRLRPGYPQPCPPKLRLEFEGGRVECEIPKFDRDLLPISQCPIAPEEATVIGRVDGRAALVANPVGAGEVIFSIFPWERILVRHARSRSRAGGPVLYRMLARRAELTPWATSENSRVEPRAFAVVREGGEPDLFVVVVNHGYGTEEARVRVDVARVIEAAGGDRVPTASDSVLREVWPERGAEHRLDKAVITLKRKEARLLRCVVGTAPLPPDRTPTEVSRHPPRGMDETAES